ncbi:MAG: hypothetical protein K2W85_14005 [Phycisphaerales bacterium]|nr:hypothetical protein [Phycisphaerales bacterium]
MRDKLRHAPAELLRKFHLGARLARYAAIAVILGSLCLGVILLVAWMVSTGPGILAALFFGVLGGTPLIAGPVGFAGWWMLTAPEIAPGDRVHERHRRGVRIAGCALAGSWLMVSGPMIAGALRVLPPGVYLPMTNIAVIVACGAAGVLAYMMPRRLCDLGARADNVEIAGALPAHDLLATATIVAAGVFGLGMLTSAGCLALAGVIGSLIALPLLLVVQAGMLQTLGESIEACRHLPRRFGELKPDADRRQ